MFYFYLSLKQISSFRIPERSDHEVWEYPGGNWRFWTFPNQHHHPAVHPSYSSALSLPAEQLHRWCASSPLWYQQTRWRWTLREFNSGAEADRQRAHARRWKPQILWDVCRAAVSALGQQLQQRWPANSWVSERMGLWQLHLHFHPGNRGANFLHSILMSPDFDTVLLQPVVALLFQSGQKPFYCIYKLLIINSLCLWRFVWCTWGPRYIWQNRYLIRECNCFLSVVCSVSGTWSVIEKVWQKPQAQSSSSEWWPGP